MKPILVDLEYVVPGSEPTLVTAGDQQAATDLPAAWTPDGHLVSRWRLTDEERQQVLAGADVYVFMVTGGRPVMPISLVVGPEQRPLDGPDPTLALRMGVDRIGGGHGGA